MPTTLSFDPGDFTFAFEHDPATERGYNPPGTTTAVRGLLNAGFETNAFAPQGLTFNAVGDERSLVFGTATLREDYIAAPYQHNPADPAELKLTVTVNVDGVATPLVFEAVPTVQSGPAGFTFNPPLPRDQPAPTTLPGSTGDADVDFTAAFAPVSFVVNGFKFTADISDIVFTQPTGPGDSGAGTNTPVDVERVSLTLRLDALPDPDIREGSNANDTFTSTGAAAIFVGAGGNDVLTGAGLADALFGQDGRDTLRGLDDNDWLSGGRGNDRLSGGAGNDQLRGGSDNDRLNGDTGDDRLFGESGNDRLDGGLGIDFLRGGSGFDTYAFTTALGTGNVDEVSGFQSFFDTIALDNAVFTGLSAGTLRGNAFHVGTAAADSSDRIIYDNVTGALYFDPDGIGGAAQVQFATLLGSPNNVKASDFFVF
ncbi:calcium-binding protein [Microvirga yunnanensis]|uniref:calcium-binding protein n=1 Tax=Microvirga yunnanensis TaxID=2953740 RepID=UPI0021C9CB53|nr:calcium-binding protein [Microvirga sp. HBU65207]